MGDDTLNLELTVKKDDDISMNHKYIDGILAYQDGVMTDKYRNSLVAELKDVEQQISQRSSELEMWEEKLSLCLEHPHVYGERTERVRKIVDSKRRFIMAGKRLRAFLLAELGAQKQYQPAYEWKN